MAIRSIETKNGRRYFFDTYYEARGIRKRYRSKLYDKKADAKQAEKAFVQPRKRKVTFEEVIDSYISSKDWKYSSERSSLKKIEHIRHYFGKDNIEELTPADCQAFLSHLDRLKYNGKYYSARYKNMVVMYLKSICKHSNTYFNTGIQAHESLRRYKVDKQERFVLDSASFNVFIKEVTNNDYRSVYVFLMYSGCRLGEALGLCWKDIDFDSKAFSINKAYSQLEKKDVPTKTASSVRKLPLTSRAYDVLLENYTQQSQKRGFTDSWRAFGGRRALTQTSATRIKDKACQKAGLPHFRLHDFRHSFISMLVANGADISSISHYVGHSAITTTLNTYTHFYDDKLKDAISKI